MDEMTVTIIGQEIFREVVDAFAEIGLSDRDSDNKVNEIKTGMLGNMKTLTYKFLIPENKVIATRKAFMVRLTENKTRLLPMYVHGDWMRIIILKNFRT